MSQPTTVYDLGIVDGFAEQPQPQPESQSQPQPKPAAVPMTTARPAAPPPTAARAQLPSIDAVADSVTLFVPGAGSMVRRRPADGWLFLSLTGFLVAMGWAILATAERLPGTLAALELPAHGAVYALEAIFIGIAWVHVGNLLFGTARGSERAHPVFAGLASAIAPGWGQLLNKQPGKAALFVSSLWLVAFGWLWVSPWTSALFEAQGVMRSTNTTLLSSPILLWTAPIVVWALAIYDAIATARR